MSQKRPATGGESCKQDSFLVLTDREKRDILKNFYEKCTEETLSKNILT